MTSVKIPNPFLPGCDTIPDEVIDELVSRFLANIPDEERENPLRACFQIELAHWFFVDNYCGEDSTPLWIERGHIPFVEFARLVFNRCPSLIKQVPNIDQIVQEFKAYKSKVPTFGAILMNQDLTKVVLVQGFSGTWGFPKGKINQDEDPAECAVRETMEETGYDSSSLLVREHFVESVYQERWTRLYFVRGVDPATAQLKPHTRFEIKNIGWFSINELPENKKDPNVVTRAGFPCSAFHGVFPYVKRLRLWIDDKLSGRNIISAFKSYAPGRPTHILDRDYSSVPLKTTKNLLKGITKDPFNDKTYIDPALKKRNDSIFGINNSSQTVKIMTTNKQSSTFTTLGLEKLTPFSTTPPSKQTQTQRQQYQQKMDNNIKSTASAKMISKNIPFQQQSIGFQSPIRSDSAIKKETPLPVFLACQEITSNNSIKSNLVKTNINPKRRLFTSDDEEQDKEVRLLDLNLCSSVNIDRRHNTLKNFSDSNIISGQFNSGSGKSILGVKNCSTSSTTNNIPLITSSSTWLSFKLDAEMILRSMISKPLQQQQQQSSLLSSGKRNQKRRY